MCLEEWIVCSWGMPVIVRSLEFDHQSKDCRSNSVWDWLHWVAQAKYWRAEGYLTRCATPTTKAYSNTSAAVSFAKHIPVEREGDLEVWRPWCIQFPSWPWFCLQQSKQLIYSLEVHRAREGHDNTRVLQSVNRSLFLPDVEMHVTNLIELWGVKGQLN